MFYVYVHRRATDNKIFYVGKGKGRRAYEINNRNNHWKYTFIKHGLIIELVCNFYDEKDAFTLERELISWYGRGNLCNYTDGGEGLSNPSDETRRKLSLAHSGRFLPERVKRIISEKTKLNWGNPEIRQRKINGINNPISLKKRSDSSKNRVISDITKQKHKDNATLQMPHVKKASADAKKVRIQCSNLMIFDSIKESIIWLKSIGMTKAKHPNIIKVMNGDRSSAYGYSWKYLNIPKS